MTATDTVLDSRGARRRFLFLRGLRYLPTGLLLPVLVLILLDRGLSLGQVGLVTAAQGVVVMLLELPTGALADALGRRRVLLAAGCAQVAALALFVVANSLPALLVVFALQGVYRALDSGPLDAWYVDTAQAADPDADIERGIAQGGVVLGLALSAGSLAGGGLVALGPVGGVDALVLPLLASLTFELVNVTAIALLMKEAGPLRPVAAREALRSTPTVIRDAIKLVRSSTVIVALVAVEFLWGFGMTSFETFTPARLTEVLGDADRAAALLGPAGAVAWLVSALGAFTAPALAARLGAARIGAVLRIIQGLTVVGIALATGPIGLLAAYLATMGIHGAANPVHQGMLHRAVTGPSTRATVVSANSLTAQTGGALGGIALGALADGTSLTTATLAGAAVLAVAAPLYLIAGRATRTAQPADQLYT
jgi:predicted MFS family arabinose efflux permease